MPRRTPKAIRGAQPTHSRENPDRVAQRIKDALDPQKAPGKPRLWKDMTEAERAQVVAAMKRR